MCSSPSPKAPKYDPIDQYQSWKQHPLYKDFRVATNHNMNEDSDVVRFKQYINERQYETEFKDADFVSAFNELALAGQLSGVRQLDLESTAAKRFRHTFKKENKGSTEGWDAAYLRSNFDYSDENDLQRVYDKVFEYDQKAIRDEANQIMQDQNKANLKEQSKIRRANNQQQRKMQKRTAKQQRLAMEAQNKQQEKMMKEMARQQRLSMEAQAAQMEEMMNQPIYQAKQAALPKVQYNPRTPDPMPTAPAPPPAMNISPTPAPELVNIGNQMGIVKQSSTARTRSRQRTRGTASLT